MRRQTWSLRSKIFADALVQAKLRGQEFGDPRRNDLSRLQQSSWVPKDAELKRKPQSLMCPATVLDVLDVIICQGVVPQKRFLICWQVEEHCPLAGIQNLAP